MSANLAVPTPRSRPTAISASSRASAAQLAKPPCTIHPSTVISDKAIITGTFPVVIAENCIIHPFAKISSTAAPVHIGRNCIIAERATVGLSSGGTLQEDTAVVLEDNVSIENGAIVEAKRIGSGSVVEVNAIVGSRAVIGKFCKICPSSHVFDEIPDYTVVISDSSRRIDGTVKARSEVRDLKIKGHAMHIETLKRLIPSSTSKWAA